MVVYRLVVFFLAFILTIRRIGNKNNIIITAAFADKARTWAYTLK